MGTILSEDALYCFDMIKLDSGEILSLCGTFDGPWYRTRLSFYPKVKSTRFIEEIPYQKVGYETGYRIPACTKLLDLPGEQHFLVHRAQIIKIYKASEAFAGLSSKNFQQCQLFIDLLYDYCCLSKDRHGLTGSGALHNIQPNSDFDWVVYDHESSLVEAYILSNDNFKRELTFEMKHVYRKYAVFAGLSRKAISGLFKDRWRYFRFQDLRISMGFIDPTMRADVFLSPSEPGKQIVIQGVVTDGIGCYHMPYIIPLNCDGKDYLALTWLFLYNSAFKKGDIVELSGREYAVKGERYILVERSRDYIRKLIG